MNAPLLSIVVIFHNMRREAKRTLLSLSTVYQQGIDLQEYEVIAIDNGSDRPLDPEMVQSLGPQFRYHFHATDSVSPVDALNLGGRLAQGKFIALIVDGARMASPGLLRATINALRLSETPVICSLSWHLGPDVQNLSMIDGYCQEVEDQLLNDIEWPANGYRLFDISTIAQSSRPGFLGGFPAECSWLCLPLSSFEALDGYDAAFQSPGGGLVNHDFVTRASANNANDFIVLLGEGVFHQIHGGVATNVKPEDHPRRKFREEYRRIRGCSHHRPKIEKVIYVGEMPQAARRFLAH